MKRTTILTLLTLMTAICTYAANDNMRKMTPWVRHIAHTTTASPVHRASCRPPQLMTAFVQTSSDVSIDDILRDYGCRPLSRRDDISIVSIPCDRLRDIVNHPAILRIEASPTAQCTMDTTALVANATPVYTPSSQHQAFTGEGVVIGLMDVGFDLTCPNFFDSPLTNKYRIGAFWDQLSTDTVGSPLPVGRDYVGKAAVLAKQCSTDSPTQQHGTHTAGIAAGSGYNTSYRGIAYESELCLVSNAVSADTVYIASEDYYKYTSATDALGFEYIFDYAERQGKPCVASFSEGYSPYMDQEDSLYAAYLDKLTGPGRIIVASAGNESIAKTFVDKPKGIAQKGALMASHSKDAFYRASTDGPARLHILCEGRTLLTMASTDRRLDSLLTDTLVVDSDTCIVSATRYASSFTPGDSIWFIQISGQKSIGRYNLALTAEGTDCHAQLFGSQRNGFANHTDDPQLQGAAEGHNILAPGCFPATICVGATFHRPAYTNHAGLTVSDNYSKDVGKWAVYSSMGPTLEGATKPDVTAPGDNIIASGNSFYHEGREPAKKDIAAYEYDGRTHWWVVETGTSMSAPVVAGVIALWLQARPDLTRDDIIGIISRTSRRPEAELDYPNNKYGWGDVDAYCGLLDLLGISSVKSVSHYQPHAAKVYAEGGMLHVQMDTRPTQPIHLTVYSLQGRAVHHATLGTTESHETLPLPALPAGVYAIQLDSTDPQLKGSQLVRM